MNTAGLPSVAQCARAIVDREVSPLELTRARLERIDRIDPVLRAFVTVDRERALRDAARLTRELDATGPRGPMHGVPVGIKDLIDVAGLPTTASSRVLAGNVATRDAGVVGRLRAAGAVILGKLNTQEFAYGVVSAPTRNPWDLERIPGGSSGGSGAAVAASLCPGALGTDTAGSVRIPSALCGITGLRPRRTTVPMDGIVPLSWSLDSCGPMAAGASDVAVMWQAMTGAAPASPRLHGLRIGVPDLDEDFLGLDDEVGAAVDQGVKALEDEGGRIAPARLPAFACWGEALGILLAAEAAAAHIEAGWYERRAEYLPETRLALDFGAGLKATEVVLARRRLGRLRARWQEVMAELDVIVLPTTPIAAPRIDELEPHEDSGHRPPIARILTRICGPINFCDLAAVSVPCGFTDDELPIGMQLVAANEDMALSAALAFQESTDWHRRAPASVPQDAPSGAT